MNNFMYLKDKMSLKSYIIKYKWLLFTLIVVVPILIHVAFYIEAPCEILVAKWKAGDALLFYGALLASVTTIAGVYIAIRHEHQSQKEERRLAIMPYLASDLKKFEGYDSQTEKLHTITCSPIEVSTDLPDGFERVYDASKLPKDATAKDDIRDNFEKKYCTIEYLLSNYGAGNALEVRFECYANSVMKEKILVCNPFPSPKNGKRWFVLIFSKEKWLGVSIENSATKIKEILIDFRFSYQDVESNTCYMQEETIKLFSDKNDILWISPEKPLSSPKPINTPEYGTIKKCREE